MKVGIISAPALLSDGLDPFDVYSVESMYDDPLFIETLSQSKSECDYSFIFIEGVGLFPYSHHSIPLQPIRNSRFVIANTLNEVCSNLADYAPELSHVLFDINIYGQFPDNIKDLFLG